MPEVTQASPSSPSSPSAATSGQVKGPDDHEIIYASTNFFATLEGQVTVFEDEAMFLLNDSHFFWWLIRVVKTGEVGYVPAEITENENERLARKNRILNSVIPDSQNTAEVEAVENITFIEADLAADGEPVVVGPKPSLGHSDSQINFRNSDENLEDDDKEQKRIVTFSRFNMEKTISTVPSEIMGESESSDGMGGGAMSSAASAGQKIISMVKNTLISAFLEKTEEEKENFHLLRIFPTKACNSNVHYKTVLVSLDLTIGNIIHDFIKRFKLSGTKEDYYISIIDTTSDRQEDLILHDQVNLMDVIDVLMNSNGERRYRDPVVRFDETVINLGLGSLSKPDPLSPNYHMNETEAALTSLYGKKHQDSKKYRILKNLRFILNKRVDYSNKLNFIFRLYAEGFETPIHYTTILVDNLMKVRDVFNIALRKFGCFPTIGKTHKMFLMEKLEDPQSGTKEITLKKSDRIQDLIEKLIKPNSSVGDLNHSRFYFLLRVNDGETSSSSFSFGDDDFFQGKITKSNSNRPSIDSTQGSSSDSSASVNHNNLNALSSAMNSSRLANWAGVIEEEQPEAPAAIGTRNLNEGFVKPPPTTPIQDTPDEDDHNLNLMSSEGSSYPGSTDKINEIPAESSNSKVAIPSEVERGADSGVATDNMPPPEVASNSKP